MNNPNSRFAYVSSDIGIKRSRFDRSFPLKTTLTAGNLYPIMVDEVLPGDTYTIDTSCLVRMSTPIHPVMDDCFLDLYYFFVPNRIVWDHWKEFMGESPQDPYINPIEYSVPILKPGVSGEDPIGPLGIPPKSILDYLGVPSRTAPSKINALPVRGFCKIWNEWFRDQNLQNAIDIDTGDADDYYASINNDNDWHQSGNYWEGNAYDFQGYYDAYVQNAKHGGDLPPVNKYHDYFTSALKEPQKGDPVAIPLSGFAPVYAMEHEFSDSYIDEISPDGSYATIISDRISSSPSDGLLIASNGDFSAGGEIVSSPGSVYFSNLYADLSRRNSMHSDVYASINDLRFAFQLQKFLEADNRGGTRYREILKQHFNVTSPDATQQIPEFLGGKRIHVNMSQVIQTSSTDDISPQGNTAAYSLTLDKHSAFTKSFTEHGFIFCVGCIRTKHTYAQGIEPMWSRFNKFDYYWPEFANISEQPIYNKELYIPAKDFFGIETDYQENGIFGYKEPWAEYRFKPARVSGEFRPTYDTPLDSWTYTDYYTSVPRLSSEWIRENRNNVDRTLAVDSDVSDQFIADFYFDMKTTRVMPIYSIPGLADHH